MRRRHRRLGLRELVVKMWACSGAPSCSARTFQCLTPTTTAPKVQRCVLGWRNMIRRPRGMHTHKEVDRWNYYMHTRGNDVVTLQALQGGHQPDVFW